MRERNEMDTAESQKLCMCRSFKRLNADPIWLHQHGYHEILHEREMKENEVLPFDSRTHEDSDDIPFWAGYGEGF